VQPPAPAAATTPSTAVTQPIEKMYAGQKVIIPAPPRAAVTQKLDLPTPPRTTPPVLPPTKVEQPTAGLVLPAAVTQPLRLESAPTPITAPPPPAFTLPKDKTPQPLLSRQKHDAVPVEKPAEPVRPISASLDRPVTPPPVKIPEPMASTPPVIEKVKDKQPAPLLSRSQRRTAPPPKTLAPPTEGEKAVRPVKPKWSWWQRSLVRLVVYAAVAGLGYVTYLNLRQTQFVAVIAAPSLELLEVNVVRDFRDDVEELRSELFLAKEPLVAQLRTNEDMATRARADVSGVEERLKLLSQEADNIRKEIEGVGLESQKSTEKIWADDDEKLNQEFEQKLREFGQRLQTRAKQLGLNYVPSDEYALPEVWVSNYRYSLYDVPKNVKTSDERLWADQQLGLWRDYEKGWDERKSQLRLKVEEVQKNTGARITRLKERLVELEQRAGDAEIELRPLKTELQTRENAFNEAQTASAGLDEPYYQQILQIPSKGVLQKLLLQKEGTVHWEHIDLLEDKFPPGHYWLWVRARKGDDEYWALVPFGLERYWESHWTIREGAFVAVRDFMKNRNVVFR
jgi:hypothetical protein